jgi:hypothetical protein
MLGACAVRAPTTPTPGATGSSGPGQAVGGYLLTTDPAVAPIDLTFRFIDQAGTSEAVDEVPAGATTEVLRTSFAGAHRMMMNGVVCDGTFEVKNRIRTLIVVAVGAGTECSVEVVGEEPFE